MILSAGIEVELTSDTIKTTLKRKQAGSSATTTHSPSHIPLSMTMIRSIFHTAFPTLTQTYATI